MDHRGSVTTWIDEHFFTRFTVNSYVKRGFYAIAGASAILAAISAYKMVRSAQLVELKKRRMEMVIIINISRFTSLRDQN